MLFGATAATGVFTVNAQGKKVQFANAASKVGETELFQWTNLSAAMEEGWEVLTGAEWSYLLADGRTDAAEKSAEGKVDGKKGLIILPDEWTQPSGAPTFQPVSEGITFGNNNYTAEQWTLMAEAGAVFLPCGGYGYDDGEGHHEVNKDTWGAYWAADEYPSDNTQAYSIHFQDGTIHDQNHYSDKARYYSVILVREAPMESIILDEMDEITAYTAKWTAAKEKSFAYVRRTLKKDYTFYTLCLPFDVPNIAASPLAGAEVFTFDGGTVSGEEGSEVLNLSLTSYTGARLSAGVPYILRWANTGETLATPLYFASVENWDDDTNAGTDPGNETIKYHGVYPRAHIPGYQTGTEAHYNFYMGANNTLYWPDDTLYPNSKMKGFRAYFYIIPSEEPDAAPVRRGMQAVWKIKNGVNSTTGVEEVRSETTSAVRCEKILRNGRVVLMINGEQYTIGGMRLNE